MPDRRFLMVLIIGLAIVGVCVYRLQINQPYDYDVSFKAATIYAPAPLFEGLDEHNQMFRLSSYLGRHRIVVVFYDGKAGADRSLALIGLRDHAAELSRMDVKTVAVSQAIPQENRAALKQLGELPCPLVSDVDGTIHQRWGRLTSDGAPLTGLFLIDRKGSVAFSAGTPRSYASWDDLWKDLRS